MSDDARDLSDEQLDRHLADLRSEQRRRQLGSLSDEQLDEALTAALAERDSRGVDEATFLRRRYPWQYEDSTAA